MDYSIDKDHNSVDYRLDYSIDVDHNLVDEIQVQIVTQCCCSDSMRLLLLVLVPVL